MEVGIVGLPNSGKTTLFNALTKTAAEVAPYPFTTIDSNVGVADVPDERLRRIAEVANSRKVTPSVVKFVDIAGLVRGASRGEGLGNQFLGYIREVDAIAHVVRCFESESVGHVEASLDPIRDLEIVNLELSLADLKVAEAALEKSRKQLKSGEKEAKLRTEALTRICEHLERGEPVRRAALNREERQALADVSLLTDKPVVYVANVSDGGAESSARESASAVTAFAEAETSEAIILDTKLEGELGELAEEERAEFLEMAGAERGLGRLIEAAYRLLDLITFFTIESNECRAWPVKSGTKASAAAGKIHTDMQRGFIKADIVPWDKLVADGSFVAAREHGHLMVEGKEYVVKDGDVILFKFAV